MERESLSKVACTYASSGRFQCRGKRWLSEARTQADSIWKETKMRNWWKLTFWSICLILNWFLFIKFYLYFNFCEKHSKIEHRVSKQSLNTLSEKMKKEIHVITYFQCLIMNNHRHFTIVLWMLYCESPLFHRFIFIMLFICIYNTISLLRSIVSFKQNDEKEKKVFVLFLK